MRARVAGDLPFTLTVSKEYIASLPAAVKMRAIVKSASDYYQSSGAAEDPKKLQTLSDDYPAKAAAEEAVADKEFKKTWDTISDDFASIAGAIGGPETEAQFKYALGSYYAWIQDAWIGAKKLWGWVTDAGKGFTQEEVDGAKAVIAELLGYGVVPRMFQDGDTSPMGYRKNLLPTRNTVRWMDEYAGPGQQEYFIDVMNAIWRASQYNVVVREDIGNLANDPEQMWVMDATRTDNADGSIATKHAVTESKLMSEAIGYAAAFDAGAPIFLWQQIVDAARTGWNGGVDDAALLMLRRDHLYQDGDFSDGSGMVSPGAGAVAANAAYLSARIKAAQLLGEHGTSIDPPKKGDAPPPTHPINPSETSTLLLFAGKTAPASKREKRIRFGAYAVGAALGGVLWRFVTPWAAPVPLIGAWLWNRRRAQHVVAGCGCKNPHGDAHADPHGGNRGHS